MLNFLGYVVLVLVFWLAPRWLGRWRWVVDVALMGYAALSVVAWLEMGRPNPLGLGYLSKGLEIGLILAAAAHARMVLRTRSVAPPSSPVRSSLPADESQDPQGAKT